jgi:hypothetical protein
LKKEAPEDAPRLPPARCKFSRMVRNFWSAGPIFAAISSAGFIARFPASVVTFQHTYRGFIAALFEYRRHYRIGSGATLGAAKLLARDEAQRLATDIEKLPESLRR